MEKPILAIWSWLDETEPIAQRMTAERVPELEKSLQAAYELGVQFWPLTTADTTSPDLRVAILCTRRCLADLRALWLLLQAGHSTSAAGVAASIWEHSFAARRVAGNPERVEEVAASVYGHVPWNPLELSVAVIDQETPGLDPE